MLERAERFSVEVSVVLSLRGGKCLRLYLLFETEIDLADSWDGKYSGTSSKRFDREVDGFLRGFNGGYIFHVVFWTDSDGSCNEGSDGHAGSGIITRFN